jgi:hypothetical protein
VIQFIASGILGHCITKPNICQVNPSAPNPDIEIERCMLRAI